MTLHILWPRSGRDHSVEEQAVAAVDPRIVCEFGRGFDQVTDEQWRRCHAIVGVAPPVEYLPKLERCRVVVKTAVGFDDVDIKAYGKLGIPVCNCPDYGTREVADHAIALMMTLVKGIAFHDEELRADPVRHWRPALNPYGRRLADCTFGVVGLGRIGTATIRRAAAFDMDCVFYDPYQPSGVELALGVRRVHSMAELMGQCDVVSVHTPLNDETRGLMGAEAFAAAGEARAANPDKWGVIVINTARGPIVDLDALQDAMRDGTVLAAGLDVLPEEPANVDAPLIPEFGAVITQAATVVGSGVKVDGHDPPLDGLEKTRGLRFLIAPSGLKTHVGLLAAPAYDDDAPQLGDEGVDERVVRPVRPCDVAAFVVSHGDAAAFVGDAKAFVRSSSDRVAKARAPFGVLYAK